jgi:hypothetical protein
MFDICQEKIHESFGGKDAASKKAGKVISEKQGYYDWPRCKGVTFGGKRCKDCVAINKGKNPPPNWNSKRKTPLLPL